MEDRIKKLAALLDKARAGGAPLGINISLPCAPLIEIAGHFPFDYLMVDQEHTLLTGQTPLPGLARAADLTGLPWFVKVAHSEPIRVRDAMDAGAWGVLLPHINSAEQLRGLMKEMRLPPVGTRGICSMSRATWHVGRARYSGGRRPVIEYHRFVNEHMCIIPTIESPEAIENLDEILAVPGYDVIHIGLEDVWMSLTGGTDMARAVAVAADLTKRIQAAGKIVMNFVDVDQKIEKQPGLMPYVPETWCFAYGIMEAIRHNGSEAR